MVADPPDAGRLPRLLAEDQLVTGPDGERLEARVARRCGVDHGVATTNRSTALLAALAALGIGDGDRVLLSPLAFVGAANAVRLRGATPLFADVRPATLTLDPTSAEHVLRHARRPVEALLVSHAFGCPADVDRLLDLAAAYDLDVIEDVGPALGATFDGAPIGGFGDAACVAPPLADGTEAGAGVVLTDRRHLASRAKRFVHNGRPSGESSVVEVGTDASPPNVLAAMTLDGLDDLSDRIAVRRSNARRLTDRLGDVPVRPPVEPRDRRHVYTRYAIRADDRDGLRRHLADHRLGTSVDSARCVHREPAYESFDALATIAERAAERTLFVPAADPLTDEAIDRIARTIHGFFDANSG